MERLTMPLTAAFIAFSWTYSYGYLMQKMTYDDLFQQAELVVIATPVRSLFIKKFDNEHFIPAWNLMEGSRAIISVRKNGDL